MLRWCFWAVVAATPAPDVVNVSDMTRHLFLSRYENREPVIIRGIVQQWPALESWRAWSNGSAPSDVRLLQSVAWDLEGASEFGSQSTSTPTDNTSLVVSPPLASSSSSNAPGLRLSDMFASRANWTALNSLAGHSNRSAAVLIDGRVLDNNPRLAHECKSTSQCALLRSVFGVNLLQALQQRVRARWQVAQTHAQHKCTAVTGAADGDIGCVGAQQQTTEENEGSTDSSTRMPPIWRYFIVSKTGGGGRMHRDPHGEHFWNAQVVNVVRSYKKIVWR